MKRGQKGWACTNPCCTGPRTGGAEGPTSVREISPLHQHRTRGVETVQGGQLPPRLLHGVGPLKVYNLSVKELDKLRLSSQGSSHEACLDPRSRGGKRTVSHENRKPQAHATLRLGHLIYTFLEIWDSPVWEWHRHCSWAGCACSLKKQMWNFPWRKLHWNYHKGCPRRGKKSAKVKISTKKIYNT